MPKWHIDDCVCNRVVCSGGSRGGARGAPLLFLDQNETQRAEKKFFVAAPPPSYLRVWMTPPCLKVWIRHWSVVK